MVGLVWDLLSFFVVYCLLLPLYLVVPFFLTFSLLLWLVFLCLLDFVILRLAMAVISLLCQSYVGMVIFLVW